MMLTRERILGFFASLVRPERARVVRRARSRASIAGSPGVVRGQLIICLVNGVLSAIGFAIVGLKYWPVLALVATVLSASSRSSARSSARSRRSRSGSRSRSGRRSFVLVWIVGIHQLEANFLNPKIMGDAAKIHPVLVVFSLLVGEHFFGIVGALLAVPCMSIAQSVFTHVRAAHPGDGPRDGARARGQHPPPPEAPDAGSLPRSVARVRTRRAR